MVPVIERIIETYQGIDHDEWWCSAVNYSGGSIKQGYDGWFLAFTPFDNDGFWQLNEPEYIWEYGDYGLIPSLTGIVTVPITLAEDSGTIYVDIEAGTFRAEEIDNTLRPVFDISVVHAPPHSPPKETRYREQAYIGDEEDEDEYYTVY